ncbi:transposase [Streptomyces sp. NPDC056638]|uniref:transposase n=1 Tax=Streptomyces sp. NPDC056638 TaxID=3345887 RepID=UPI00369B127E
MPDAVTATWPQATVQTCVIHLIRASLRFASEQHHAKLVCRSAEARFVSPARRRAPMARLRQVAMARGAVLVRSWEASSANVTSLTWCRASTFQWSLIKLASSAGVACSAVRPPLGVRFQRAGQQIPQLCDGSNHCPRVRD